MVRRSSATPAGMDLEGIVSKRLGSRYVSGRTRAWLKTKISRYSNVTLSLTIMCRNASAEPRKAAHFIAYRMSFCGW